jgi:hypothetical protein
MVENRRSLAGPRLTTAPTGTKLLALMATDSQSHSCNCTCGAHSQPASEPRVLDVRPVFASGGSPCSLIDQTVAELAPGQSMILIAPFQPVPLFTKLGQLGYSAHPQQTEDGAWAIEFRPGMDPADAPALPAGQSACGAH